MENYGALKPKSAHNLAGSTPITTGAYVQVVAAIPRPAAAFQLINTTGSVLKIAVGGVGQEVDVPFFIGPSQTSPIVPFDIAGGARISARAVDTNTAAGQLVVNLLG